MNCKLTLGDNRKEMKKMEANSVDAIVTDPPYGLAFMNKKWDYDVPGITTWKEALRVLKPGGYLLSFAGSRTYHRIAANIEDAGFEIRNQIMWIYGSGFPKSMDVSKAIDKCMGVYREDKWEGLGRKIGPTGNKKCDDCGKWLSSGTPCKCPRPQDEPQSPQAKQWQGWGTDLKPAHEPIVVARKPLEGTVAENVLKYGTGAINIDACRIEFQNESDYIESTQKNQHKDFNSNDGIRVPTKGIYHGDYRPPENYNPTQGRFPANVIHDGSEEVERLFPESSTTGKRKNPLKGYHQPEGGEWFGRKNHDGDEYQDTGSAARFFYCAKAAKSERNYGLEGFEEKKRDGSRKEGNPGGDNPRNRGVVKLANHHPTVKPLSLMRYLVRLVTQPDGTVLDPFMGSGSTGMAAKLEGMNFIGIELEKEYFNIAEARIKNISEVEIKKGELILPQEEIENQIKMEF